MGDDQPGYLLENRHDEAGVRLAALARLFDPSTVRHLDDLGIDGGWHCWEVGAGGPSVASWMAARVGSPGSVLATDIDVSWMPGAAGRTFEVRRHDVALEEPPPGPFDLVHARLVLVHLPRRAEAMAAMVSVLKPGGWLVVEDADPALQPLTCIDEFGPEQALANKLRRDFRSLLADRGADPGFGRTLPRALRDCGLVDVAADAFFPVSGPDCTVLERATVEQIRGQLVAAGLATDGEIDRHLRNIDAGGLDFATSPMISAWGRKPAAEPPAG
ncbi:MAG TPA: methyltransferase domain-containing protein [Acidimicrobiales bacterium]|nr:methyltransferase domain-containing protein [Acidimicrobiales bacterium]